MAPFNKLGMSTRSHTTIDGIPHPYANMRFQTLQVDGLSNLAGGVTSTNITCDTLSAGTSVQVGGGAVIPIIDQGTYVPCVAFAGDDSAATYGGVPTGQWSRIGSTVTFHAQLRINAVAAPPASAMTVSLPQIAGAIAGPMSCVLSPATLPASTTQLTLIAFAGAIGPAHPTQGTAGVVGFSCGTAGNPFANVTLANLPAFPVFLQYSGVYFIP